MSNGSVIGLTKVAGNGPDSRRYNLVILAEATRRASYRISYGCVEFVAAL
jgi:hypothetical protein